jgi:ketosteroid isomerase-like protein
MTNGSRRSYGERVIEQTVEQWHRFVAGDATVLADLLADDVVFYSPVVFTPQRGKEITSLYLQGAAQVLGGEDFRYTKQVLAGNDAVLEFETTVDGKHVNGVDIISCDDAARIVEFRVMLRPLQAVNVVHQKMGELLAR